MQALPQEEKVLLPIAPVTVKQHEYVSEEECEFKAPPGVTVESESCDDYELPNNQTAGHSRDKGYTDWLCKPEKHLLLKPFLGKKSYHEKQFYSTNYATLSQGLKEFLPEFYGLKYIKFPNGKLYEYIAMKDFSTFFKKPSILDIKMGRRTYDDDAEQWKIDYEISKFPQQEQTGMRFAGMKLFNKITKTYTKFDAKQARNITEDLIPQTLTQFFTTTENKLRIDFLLELQKKLKELLEVFEKAEDGMKFVAASILSFSV